MKKIIAISSFWPLPEELLAKISAAAPDYELLDLSTNPTDEQLAECEILFGNAKADIISKMPNLKWVHAQTAGVESFLNPANPLPKDIALTNSSGAYGIAIGEHMLNFTMMLLRNSAGYLSQQRQHIWRGITATARNLYNRNVTVIGLGDIGGRYAMLCHALGANVSGVVRTPRSSKPEYINTLYTTDQIEDAIKDADIVALALPGTGETAGILSRQRLAAMKKGVIIVNIGRGSAIDQAALVELLQSGHIGGAGLDVTTPEPLPQDSPLWDMENVIITPHVSHGGRDNTSGLVVDKFVRYLKDYLAGRGFERVIDRKAGY
ncbi:MAG: D-2-hydroxyacid dehydrogenase [Defluviitaleaceae bacterium]|nr:D-2-hydroxyacid dehydrogenase [Defluviitaleaceae bacterium]